MGNDEVQEDVVAVVGSIHALGEQAAGVVGVHVVVVPVGRQHDSSVNFRGTARVLE